MMRAIVKRLIILSAIFVLALLIACDRSSQGEKKTGNPVSEYGDAMVGAYKRGQQAGELANLDAVKKTVQAFHAANDRYPRDLDEIKDMIGSKIDLSVYDYNPENGDVSLKK